MMLVGRKLIDRRGRRIVLTTDREQIANLAAPMASQVSAIQQLGRSSSTEAQGHAKISAPLALSTVLLAKPVVALRERFPDIQIILVDAKRFASLNKREADVAIKLMMGG